MAWSKKSLIFEQRIELESHMAIWGRNLSYRRTGKAKGIGTKVCLASSECLRNIAKEASMAGAEGLKRKVPREKVSKSSGT